MKLGETAQAHYSATNKFVRATTARATFNVQPEFAGSYFNKVECFCFTDTTLKPGETLDMPVVFYVDPDIVNAPELKDLKTITLSYTMFPVEKNEKKKPVVLWWSDTIREAHEGHHTRVVSLHLRYGMIMFIASEVMFFVAWFWAFFDASLFPGEAQQYARATFTGGVWPPKGVEVL
ncbi:MAG: hypothetical protein E5Y76_05890, partial [Mesorhizobium sp.]